MNVQVIRETFTSNSTIGKMYIGGRFFCYTLEDVDRDKNKDGDLNDIGEQKVYGQTAIPKGKYDVIINMSNRFKVLMPLIQNVPGFEGIRIHNGNYTGKGPLFKKIKNINISNVKDVIEII
jgi:hypothetical protein